MFNRSKGSIVADAEYLRRQEDDAVSLVQDQLQEALKGVSLLDALQRAHWNDSLSNQEQQVMARILEALKELNARIDWINGVFENKKSDEYLRIKARQKSLRDAVEAEKNRSLTLGTLKSKLGLK